MLVKCTSCGRSLRLPDNAGGRAFRCPCGSTVKATRPPGAAPPPPAPPPPPSQGTAVTPVGANAAAAAVEPIQEQSTWRWAVEKLGPWGVSGVIHVALLLIFGMITVWVVRPEKELAEVQYIPPSDKPHPKPKPSVSIETTNVLTDAQPMATKINTRADAPIDVIGVVDAQSAAWNTDWSGVPFGSTTGQAGFFGIRGRGKRIVYLIDHSSSMGIDDRIGTAKAELKRSLSNLNPKVKFKVIFFQDGAIELEPGKGLLPATKGNVQSAIRWMYSDQFVAVGHTDPTRAVQRAFKLQPDVIFLLTDGDFMGRDIPALIRRLNGTGTWRVKVHTVALGDDEGRKTLQQIARESGGKYEFVKGAR